MYNPQFYRGSYISVLGKLNTEVHKYFLLTFVHKGGGPLGPIHF